MSTEIVHAGVMRAERDGGRGYDWRCLGLCPRPNPMQARYIYAGLFLLANILAWAVREEHVKFFEGQRRYGCQGHRDCLAAEGVLLTSHTSFLFFLVMFLTTVGTRKLQDQRNSWHSQWWLLKLVLLVGCIVISTFVPSYWIQLYGEAAPFGAGIFLFIQLLSVIRYITRWNYKWCHLDFENRYLEVIAVSIIVYAGSMVGIILMSLWYTGCRLNIAFIGITMMLVLLMPLIALKSKANGFYMEPGLVGAYCVFLCAAAITSEPETDCYKKKKGAGAWAHFKIIMGFVVELVSTTVAVLTTGKDYKCIQLRNVVVESDGIPYGYGFFHFVFGTGSMYFAMLFVGWDTHHTTKGNWSVDIGWTSAWVHIVNEGLAVISFVAILLARIYGIGWLRQLLARIFGIGGGGQQQQSSEMQALSRRNDDDDDDGAPPSSPSTVDLEDDMIGHGGPPPVPSPVVPLLHDQDEIISDGTTPAATNADDPPPPPGHAAGSSSSGGGPGAACATDAAAARRRPAGRRGNNWMRLARNAMLCCLCVHVILICFASLYMLLYAQRSTLPSE